MSATSDRFQIDGFRVGHWTHPSGATGCTVVLAEQPATAVAEVRGGAPGTREIALLDQGRLVHSVDAVLLTGGSAFGLAAADGVVAWLREHGRGFASGSIPVPIVAAAVIFDLVGPSPVWPDGAAGYAAAAAATSDGWQSGRLGAGSGATVGKVLGRERSSPGGIGVARVESPAGRIAALVAVNALGDVVDPDSGAVVAGTTAEPGGRPWANSEAVILAGFGEPGPKGTNTTIGVVIVEAPADRDALARIAVAAHGGLARTIRPAHTVFDGDTLFVLTQQTGTVTPRDVLGLSTAAQRAVAQAVLNGVRGHDEHA